jgi:hypothetical protein
VPAPVAARSAPAAPPPPPAPRPLPPQIGAEPIPFPQPQRPPAESEPEPAATPSLVRRSAATAAPTRPASGHFADTVRPTRIESVFALADALDDIAGEPASSPAAEFEPARPPEPPSPAAAARPVDEPLPEYLALSAEEPAPATAAEEVAEGPPAAAGDAAKVSDLEREMARLLGEITSRRGT